MFGNNSQLPPVNSPHPPRNAFVTYSHFKKNCFEISWDDPAIDYNNKAFSIVGVNVYRSFDSEIGEYIKLNDNPIGAGFYSDCMTHTLVEEDVSNQFVYKGNGPSREWIFETKHRIVKDDPDLIYANTATDVRLTIDGVEVPVARVRGEEKSVRLITEPYLDKLTRELHKPVLPKEDSVVVCSYRYNTNFISIQHNQRTFYKLSTVLEDGSESALQHFEPISNAQIESWDYIWREAVRRNRWILQQGGEDCFVRLRKWNGDRCHCYSDVHQRAKVDCETCWGTGIVGGYEGPFPFLMAPIEAENRLTRGDQGLHNMKTSTLWTNLPPKLNTFDLIYRRNGEIYVVGYVKHAEVRGNSFLQQEFNASLLSRDRVEYRIPFAKAVEKVFVSEKANIPDDQEVRGRTVTFENITY